LAGCVVAKESIVDGWETTAQNTVSAISERLESQSMCKFMQENRYQIDSITMITIQPVIPRAAGKTIRRSKVQIKLSTDFRGTSVLVRSRDRVSERGAIPRTAERGIWKIPSHTNAAGRTQSSRVGIAWQASPTGADSNYRTTINC